MERRRHQSKGRRLACPASSPHGYGEEWYDNPASGLDRARERIADAPPTAVERPRPADTAPYFPSLEQVVTEADRLMAQERRERNSARRVR